jgi:dTDP-4-amino-4,6-dideoxygalactose transaminase
VDFVDIDPATFNISPESLEKKLIEAQKLDRLPKILIAVHFGGQPCEMQAIHALSKKYGFSVVEDASHALGGKYQDESIGNCRFSDVTVFSFHPVKIITTAEGGIAMTNDKLIAQKMVQLRSHGITRNADEMTHTSDGPWFYQQIELGFNYRMTELQAALGLSQLKRLDSFVASRHKLAKRYNKLLEQFPIVTQLQIKDSYTSFHLYAIRLQLNKINKSQLEIFNELLKEGIGVNLHYIPVHIHPYYKNLGFKIGDFIEAENYYAEAISIPIFQDMTDLQQDEVCAALKKVLAT